MREGDVVLELDREPVQTVGDFEEAMRGTTAGGNALYCVPRDDVRVFIACETSDDLLGSRPLQGLLVRVSGALRYREPL